MAMVAAEARISSGDRIRPHDRGLLPAQEDEGPRGPVRREAEGQLASDSPRLERSRAGPAWNRAVAEVGLVERAELSADPLLELRRLDPKDVSEPWVDGARPLDDDERCDPTAAAHAELDLQREVRPSRAVAELSDRASIDVRG